ncbi:CAP domain-containing protein [Nocardioides sp.]|uniref:CAP domain-containing protein n=1 Tax=Nocardioides sp. TaxID=35761 RepID=UPI0027344581|nr:CAP domain-containing protein [Nocardioides sp.]MDP3890782.1 CAP domain-containing protein [Nocardioides sp.]
MRTLLVASTLLLLPLVGLGTPASGQQPITVSSASASATSVDPRAARAGRASAEKRVVRLTNKRRANHGCKPLKVRKPLRRAARRHSARMAEAGVMSHQLPGEPPLGKRVTAAGYTNWTMVGENIAFGYTSPRALVRAWMRSPSHRAQILTCRYRHIGVGRAHGNGTVWWTQVFGRK